MSDPTPTFRVTLTIDVQLAPAFVKRGVPDRQMLLAMAKYKLARQSTDATTVSWSPKS